MYAGLDFSFKWYLNIEHFTFFFNFQHASLYVAVQIGSMGL